MNKIIVSGGHGYLLTHVLPYLNNNIIHVSDVYCYQDFLNVDMVIHFASPSDKEDFKKPYMHKTMIDGTINMIDLAKRNEAHFVFASTMGVHTLENDYCIFKYAMEKYIQKELNSYSILRIPRVYSKDRNKGLIKQIKQNNINVNDMNNIIEYITIEDFMEFFFNNYNKQGIFEINQIKYKKNSIKQLSELYK